ncbi:hypothetical protein PInf_005197 [Phytophthora infestans]|nr:hypothetical protein PInf_005197 [Phytophthora infestans]
MAARRRTSGEEYNAVTQPIKESFDAELLQAFCMLCLRKDVTDITEAMLIAELEALLSKVKMVPDVKALFKLELHMDLKETDVDARTPSYFQNVIRIVEENGLDKCRTMKEAKTAEKRSNGKQSQPNVIEGAQEKKRGLQSKHNKKLYKKTDRKVCKGAAPTKPSRDPPSPCPKCNVMPWLRDRPKATEEEKVTLHTGSDNTVISQPHRYLLRAADSTVQAETLDTPVRSVTYGGHTVVANQKTMLHILIHTAAGAV